MIDEKYNIELMQIRNIALPLNFRIVFPLMTVIVLLINIFGSNFTFKNQNFFIAYLMGYWTYYILWYWILDMIFILIRPLRKYLLSTDTVSENLDREKPIILANRRDFHVSSLAQKAAGPIAMILTIIQWYGYGNFTITSFIIGFSLQVLFTILVFLIKFR